MDTQVCVSKSTVDIYRPWTHTTDSGHTGMGQQREGIDCVLVRQCVKVKSGHIQTVDTQPGLSEFQVKACRSHSRTARQTHASLPATE